MINTTIKINGEQSIFTNVDLMVIKSYYNRHHSFSATLGVPEHYPVEQKDIEDALGGKIEIVFSKNNFPNEQGIFIGTIDEIIPTWYDDGRIMFIINGYSPTHFLDGGPEFRCFKDQSLESVIQKLLNPYKQFFNSVTLGARSSQKLDWNMQQNETTYQFICRLADQFEQEFYYDGEGLFFQDLASGTSEMISLVQGNNLEKVRLSMNLAPLKFTVQGYDFVNGKKQESKSEKLSAENPVLDMVIKKCQKYPEQKILLPYAVEGTSQLQRATRRFASRQAHELLKVSGKSFEPRLKIGSRITVEFKKRFLKEGLEGHELVVTEVTHVFKDDNSYYNEFVAVPTEHPYNLRMTRGRGPVSGPKAAIIADVDDPKKMGRVRVQYIGDLERAISPWLRVLTASTTDGGFFCLPQVDEQVLVLSEDFNLENNAIVLGSFFQKYMTAGFWPDPSTIGIKRGKTGNLMDGQTHKTWGKTAELLAENQAVIESEGTYINCNKGKIPAT
ncbi:MAG: phage baseplate assembly protein V [Bacteroidota bacterium]